MPTPGSNGIRKIADDLAWETGTFEGFVTIRTFTLGRIHRGDQYNSRPFGRARSIGYIGFSCLLIGYDGLESAANDAELVRVEPL